jgi:hypothetical protein
MIKVTILINGQPIITRVDVLLVLGVMVIGSLALWKVVELLSLIPWHDWMCR